MHESGAVGRVGVSGIFQFMAVLRNRLKDEMSAPYEDFAGMLVQGRVFAIIRVAGPFFISVGAIDMASGAGIMSAYFDFFLVTTCVAVASPFE